MVQIAERVIKESLKKHPSLWWQKLQNIHSTPTPADFIVLGDENRYLIECKETKFDKPFSFNRLTQKQDLIHFHNLQMSNLSYIFFLFRRKTLKKSYMFFIKIDDYLEFEKTFDKKSANLNDFLCYFITDIKVLPGSVINIKDYIF